MVKSKFLCMALVLILMGSGCRMAYVFHAAAGQLRLMSGSIPVDEALKDPQLDPECKARLHLVARIKAFGEEELGLKKTDSYETAYLRSPQCPIYLVAAAPKDRLCLKTWWFPVVGDMPYLGFFDLEEARAEKRGLAEEGLDVYLGMAAAYSTLGWLNDPVTLNVLEGSTVDLVETILHEMTHTTLYVKGQGAFNEGLAVLVGKVGAAFFLEKAYGPSHSWTREAQNALMDERLFSSLLDSLLENLQGLYASSMSPQEKLRQRDAVFQEAILDFSHMKHRFRTERFLSFGDHPLNNAYLLCVGLYHRYYPLFEAVLEENQDSIKKTLMLFKKMAGEGGDMLEKTRAWLEREREDTQ